MKFSQKCRLAFVLPALVLLACGCQRTEDLRQEYMDFLYASMPLPDSVDYCREYWLENIDCALKARQEMPWGKSVPEREWRHFVLPVRVNNENLDESRMVFYDELKERIVGLSMSEAILEVNHWCHEKVTYQPSDERTSSPLATVKSAIGRCGEESTFLVSALRAVGIPARQVYTPRWAHTDDNHAWVEAWADGRWHFLGACEPEAVLDLGWFNAPASRGMLMHTKAFGQYDGPEEVMQRTHCYTEIDVTSNYAPVARAYAKVIDAEGYGVEEATVEFKIYNYAEFYTVSTKTTDNNGVTSIQAGKGDLVAWAYKGGRYGFSHLHVNEGDTIEVVLNHKEGERYSFDMEIVPPVERNTVPPMTDEQRQENTRRLAVEDSIRNAYVSTFVDEDGLMKKSRGNYTTLQAFFNEADDPVRALDLLNSISEKDLRDVSLDVLMDSYQLTQQNQNLTPAQYNKYVLSPRVANEKLTPFRKGLNTIPMMEVKELIRWVKDNIAIDTERNPQQLRMTPEGVLRNRKCDAVSRNIFFVALARTQGIPARIDAVTGKTQYLSGDRQWRDVNFETEKTMAPPPPAEGRLQLTYGGDHFLTDPKYYPHFTLSRIVEGSPRLLNYGEEDTWQSLFGRGNGQWLDAGDYLLITGRRMADGSVLVHGEVSPIVSGHQTTLPLVMRHATEGLQVIGSLNAEHLYRPYDQNKGVSAEAKSILSTTGRGFYALGMIAPSNEPTNHTLRDIAQYKEALDEWGGTLLLLFRNEDEAFRFRQEEFPGLPQKTVFGIDHTGAILDELTREMHLQNQVMPVFVIADTFNRIVFCSEGYTIGLGEQLAKGLVKIKS